jgi:hypothetical protein
MFCIVLGSSGSLLTLVGSEATEESHVGCSSDGVCVKRGRWQIYGELVTVIVGCWDDSIMKRCGSGRRGESELYKEDRG